MKKLIKIKPEFVDTFIIAASVDKKNVLEKMGYFWVEKDVKNPDFYKFVELKNKANFAIFISDNYVNTWFDLVGVESDKSSERVMIQKLIRILPDKVDSFRKQSLSNKLVFDHFGFKMFLIEKIEGAVGWKIPNTAHLSPGDLPDLIICGPDLDNFEVLETQEIPNNKIKVKSVEINQVVTREGLESFITELRNRFE